MDGSILLIIGAALTFVDLLVGFFLARRGEKLALYSEAKKLSNQAGQRAGLIVMAFSPVFLIVFALIAFGRIPVEGIEPISF